MSGVREFDATEPNRTTTRLTERQLWELAAGEEVTLDLDSAGDGPTTVRLSGPPAPGPE